jgi:hypothetical protein
VIVSINQPAYLPWLGYFDRILKSDIHVVLDHVQFEKNSMVNCNRIRTAQGSMMLTVPVRTVGKFGRLPLNTLEIDNTQNWVKKHWRSIKESHARAPFAAAHLPFFEGVFGREWTRLLPLMNEITGYLLKSFAIPVPILSSTEMKVGGGKSALILNICKELGARTYISGPFGRDYLDLESFRREGIEVVFQNYNHPAYPQLHGAFEPYMSAIDLLMNCGPDSGAILRGRDEVSCAYKKLLATET